MDQQAQDALELAAGRALKGSEKVLQRLGALIDFHFSDTAFAIKRRIKHQEAIIKKVRGRDEGYSCDDVRDIVGFRIIDLYRVSVPETFRAFHSLILLARNDLFASPANVTVKIYWPEIEDEMYSRALREVLDALKISPLEDKKPSRYSSIHLQTMCDVVDRGGVTRRVPVEVQFRSAMEDVWSEMEHKLKYKDQYRAQDEDHHANKDLLDHLLERMREQKREFDILEEKAGKIEFEYRKRTSPVAPYAPTNEQVIGDRLIEALSKGGLGEAADLHRRAIRLRQSAQEIAKEDIATLDTPKLMEATQLLEDSSGVFRDILKAAEGLATLTEENRSFTSTIIRLEVAFNSFETGRVWRRGGLEEAAKRHFDEAARVYSELLRQRVDNVLVPYRLAQVRFVLGDFDGALNLLEDVAQSIDQDEIVQSRPSHWLQVDYRRFTGLVRWNAAEAIKDYATLINRPEYKRADRIALYVAAFRITHEALPLRLEAQPDSPPGVNEETETAEHRRKAANNLLSYLCDLAELEALDEALKALGIGEANVVELLGVLGASTPAEILQLPTKERADSALVSYMKLFGSSAGYHAQIGAAARVLLRRLAEFRSVSLPSGEHPDWNAKQLLMLVGALKAETLPARENEMLTAARTGLELIGLFPEEGNI